MQKYINAIQDYIPNMRTLICVLGMVCLFSFCGWKDAQEVIAMAERMDKTEHVVYDDTAAIAGVIRK